jgi:tetraacyldisaccharide 4'-kinase
LLAQRSRCPVWIGRDRVAAASALLAVNPGCNVIVSDDGLQHYGLRRDVEIAVVDGARGTGNGLPLPAGPLRESTGRLACVDAVVVTGDSVPPAAGAATFAMTLEGSQFRNLLNPAFHQEAAAFQGKRVHAVAGIGNPARFFEHLAALGVAARGRAFPDHHAFQPAELRMPDAEVIVMTEKDAVKCAAFADARMWFMRVEAILPIDFDEFLLSRIKARADGRQAA